MYVDIDFYYYNPEGPEQDRDAGSGDPHEVLQQDLVHGMAPGTEQSSLSIHAVRKQP